MEQIQYARFSKTPAYNRSDIYTAPEVPEIRGVEATIQYTNEENELWKQLMANAQYVVQNYLQTPAPIVQLEMVELERERPMPPTEKRRKTTEEEPRLEPIVVTPPPIPMTPTIPAPVTVPTTTTTTTTTSSSEYPSLPLSFDILGVGDVDNVLASSQDFPSFSPPPSSPGIATPLENFPELSDFPS